MAEIELQSVRKTFGKVVAVNDISLTIHDREFMVLLGPSGCGKTTLLRAIAGLEQIDAGRVLIAGKDVTDQPPRKRNIAMVFQSYAVFPHLTVFENIAFGLRMKKVPQDEVNRRVGSAAELLRITELLQRFPAQLSGGQRQRVAVARALAVDADVPLMDEPLSNLDALLRLEMRSELKRLLNEAQATVVYVTHDQVEALSLGDRIAVMRSGNILQCDTPLAVYDCPADMFVGGFIGNPPMNFLPADKLDPHFLQSLPSVPDGYARLALGIRAENIKTHVEPASGTLLAEVIVTEPLGSHNLVTARVGDAVIKVNTRADMMLGAGQRIWLEPKPDKIRWMDSETRRAAPTQVGT